MFSDYHVHTEFSDDSVYPMIAGVKTVRVAVTSPLGNILGHYERDFQHLDYMAIEGGAAGSAFGAEIWAPGPY